MYPTTRDAPDEYKPLPIFVRFGISEASNTKAFFCQATGQCGQEIFGPWFREPVLCRQTGLWCYLQCEAYFGRKGMLIERLIYAFLRGAVALVETNTDYFCELSFYEINELLIQGSLEQN